MNIEENSKEATIENSETKSIDYSTIKKHLHDKYLHRNDRNIKKTKDDIIAESFTFRKISPNKNEHKLISITNLE